MNVKTILLMVVMSSMVLGVHGFASEGSGGENEAAPARKSETGESLDVGTASGVHDYLLLATQKTSTMEKELREAAGAGYRFETVMGGETGFGGSEVVVLMSRDPEGEHEARYDYQLLATSKTSTMQKELQEAGDAGFEYKGQTVFNSAFGGSEVVVILERDRDAEPSYCEYKLLATNKTSTMQKELREAGEAGFGFVGLTVSSTRFGGSEIVTILRRAVD